MKNKQYRRRLMVIGGFFFLFGFVTWVNGTLIPYLTIACELQAWQAYLVTFAFYISYTVMAFPSSKVLQHVGMLKGMRIGLLIMALGCLLFIPAAMTRTYLLFLMGLFVEGIGLTLLQTAVNPYITALGPMDKAAQRISIMGICNKFAGMIAPLVLGSVILKNADGLMAALKQMDSLSNAARLDDLARLVIIPYSILVVVLIGASLLMKYAGLPEIGAAIKLGHEPAGPVLTESVPAKRPLPVWTGFVAIFATVGAEVMAGDTIANYGLYHGLALSIAKNLTSFTLFGMIAGYLIGTCAIPTWISQEKAFLYSAVLGVLVVLLVMLLPGTVSVAMVALLGFANALLWPAIWPQALEGFSGARLNSASAVLIMGIAGGAMMPLMYGWLAGFLNFQVAYVILLPAYLYDMAYWRIGNLRNKKFQREDYR